MEEGEEKISLGDVMPDAPQITDEEWAEARRTGSYQPVAFKWFVFVGQICQILADIDKNTSEDVNNIPSRNLHVLVGLMNRCSKLMLSAAHMCHEGKFGETASIIFRCIFESSLKIKWLCTNVSDDKFLLFVTDGLQPEMELKDKINANITSRGGTIIPLEQRMLDSIEKHIEAGEVSEDQVRNSGQIPNIADMINSVGFDRLMYVAIQRMGSHHVHGTWPSLIFHYLEENNDKSGYIARTSTVSVHSTELLMVSLMVVLAMDGYCEYYLKPEAYSAFNQIFEATEQEIMDVFSDMSQYGH